MFEVSNIPHLVHHLSKCEQTTRSIYTKNSLE